MDPMTVRGRLADHVWDLLPGLLFLALMLGGAA